MKRISTTIFVFKSILICSLLIIFNSLISCNSAEKKSEDNTEQTATSDTIKEGAAEVLELPVAQGNPLAEAEARATKSGFIIAGEGPEVRAFTAFRSGETMTGPYIKMLGEYRKAFPDLNIYAVVIPGASAYYMPNKVADVGKPVKPAYDYLRANLDSTIKYVDVYNHLAGHTREDIFLRTDHHWAPLGGYYTARALAAQAGVPFKDLSEYDEHVVHGYVGSMYNYTKERALKENPEDFHYYTPKNKEVTTTYVTIRKDKETEKITEGKPYKGDFFHHYKDGSGGAYCTFMGGDHFIVKVETGTPNSRRLLIIKDSHANPIPAYLFHSFEEIHVIDYRYFARNLKKYIEGNKITDIAPIFGISTSSAPGHMKKVADFITQSPESQKPSSDSKRK